MNKKQERNATSTPAKMSLDGNSAAKLERDRKYRENHREALAEKQRERYARRKQQMSADRVEAQKKLNAEKSKRWRTNNIEKFHTQNKSRYEANIDQSRARGRQAYHTYKDTRQDYLRRNRDNIKDGRHGLTRNQKRLMAEVQGYCCAICSEHKSELRLLHVDHNHVTGQVRLLLCNNCNHMLGHAHDSELILYKAIKYLRDHSNSEAEEEQSK